MSVLCFTQNSTYCRDDENVSKFIMRLILVRLHYKRFGMAFCGLAYKFVEPSLNFGLRQSQNDAFVLKL